MNDISLDQNASILFMNNIYLKIIKTISHKNYYNYYNFIQKFI